MSVMVVVDEFKKIEALARQGDMHAFGQLIRAWDQDLRGVAWAVSRSAGHTDDIMQTTYEKAVRSLADFRGTASLKTWLHSICYRAAIDHVRFEQRRQHEQDIVLSTKPSRQSTSEVALAKTALAEILQSLDHETRAALMLTTGLGYSFDEAADILALPRGTVASKVRRAKQTLQQQNEQNEQEETQ